MTPQQEADKILARSDNEMDELLARLAQDRDALLVAAKLALAIGESWIHDQLDGTSSLRGALSTLDPVRAAIARAEARQ